MAYYEFRKPGNVLSLHTMCRDLSCKWLVVLFKISFEISLHGNLHGNLHRDLTAASFQTIARPYCTCANDIF